jgi:hypothetical protein
MALSHQILDAINILDGNDDPIDWRDQQHPELLRKLCEHLEAFGSGHAASAGSAFVSDILEDLNLAYYLLASSKRNKCRHCEETAELIMEVAKRKIGTIPQTDGGT